MRMLYADVCVCCMLTYAYDELRGYGRLIGEGLTYAYAGADVGVCCMLTYAYAVC